MDTFCDRLARVHARIAEAARRHGRSPEEITLLAVSKTQPAERIREALACGQRAFGENYARELADKAQALAGEAPEWHFIGPDPEQQDPADRRSVTMGALRGPREGCPAPGEQRPSGMPPLRICLQVNVSGEASKSGVAPAALPALAEAVAELPGIELRGLMAIPAPSEDEDLQRRAFARVRELLEDLNRRDTGWIRCPWA
jgi:PLP dependent protein